jgi:hypothetical protein
VRLLKGQGGATPTLQFCWTVLHYLRRQTSVGKKKGPCDFQPRDYSPVATHGHVLLVYIKTQHLQIPEASIHIIIFTAHDSYTNELSHHTHHHYSNCSRFKRYTQSSRFDLTQTHKQVQTVPQTLTQSTKLITEKFGFLQHNHTSIMKHRVASRPTITFVNLQHCSQQRICLFKPIVHRLHFSLGLTQQALVFFKCALLSLKLCLPLFLLPSSFLPFYLEGFLKLSLHACF